jgi:hypothetical protein
VEADEFACPAGSFIYIPSGLRHGFRVGPLPSRKLNLYTPAAMVGYFEALSAAITSGNADPGRLDEIARAGRELRWCSRTQMDVRRRAQICCQRSQL